MITREQHLLVCLMEECAEVQKEVAKILRFGIGDRNVLDPEGPDNRERLVSEVVDLIAVLEMLAEEGTLATLTDSDDETLSGLDTAISRKKAKVERFMEYARGVEALT